MKAETARKIQSTECVAMLTALKIIFNLDGYGFLQLVFWKKK